MFALAFTCSDVEFVCLRAQPEHTFRQVWCCPAIRWGDSMWTMGSFRSFWFAMVLFFGVSSLVGNTADGMGVIVLAILGAGYRQEPPPSVRDTIPRANRRLFKLNAPTVCCFSSHCSLARFGGERCIPAQRDVRPHRRIARPYPVSIGARLGLPCRHASYQLCRSKSSSVGASMWVAYGRFKAASATLSSGQVRVVEDTPAQGGGGV